ncbi:MAG: type II toxin-antitoxin system VapC family toxin [Pleurocapsa sp. CRU_1_2]|nr:type II toxin-antitoxin system VapC family toxin [Pleurocapsa sp. CRU_1_2]
MKVLFDTSVLVAAFEVSHSRHSVCLPWLQRAQEKEIDGYLSTHTLAELYSVLTRLPVRPPISPPLAQRLVDSKLRLKSGNHKRFLLV